MKVYAVSINYTGEVYRIFSTLELAKECLDDTITGYHICEYEVEYQL